MGTALGGTRAGASVHSGVKFAKVVYWAAGIWGVLLLTPLYFIIHQIALRDPPAVTHPLFYYGFAGVGLAWQAAFMIIATCPMRYRPTMIATWVEKFSFGAAAWALYLQGRLHAAEVGFASIDLLWLALFIVAYVRTPARPDDVY